MKGWKHIAVFTLPLLILFIVTGCSKPPVKIGFVGGLTGKISDLGISGRNALQLAIDEMNAQGGIDGRQVELISLDDGNDPELARNAVQTLINRKVDVIIGHMVSTMTLASLPLVNTTDILMVSPTTSTNELTGLDDNFIRMIAELSADTTKLSDHAFNNMGIRSIVPVLDYSNRIFSLGWWDTFEARFTGFGGTVSDELIIDGNKDIDYFALADKIKSTGSDAVLLITNAFNTAMICQQMNKLDINIQKLSCAWSMTKDVIHNGGTSVDGLVYSMAIYEEENEKLKKFIENYSNRFGAEPDFAAIKTYDAAYLVQAGLRVKKKNQSLKEAILTMRDYNGIEGPVILDEFGERIVEYSILIIQNGDFVPLQ